MKKVLLFSIVIFIAGCNQESKKLERFVGTWIPTIKGNELIPKDLINGTVVTISKEGHLYFANPTILRDGKKIDMYASLAKEKFNMNGTQVDLAKQMFTYELSKDGSNLSNELKPTEIIQFDSNNGLIKYPFLGEFTIWMEHKN